MKFKNIIIIILAICLSACSLLAPIKTVPTKNYTLMQTALQFRVKKSSHETILVTTPIASAGLANNQMLIYAENNQVYHYPNSQWQAGPSEMLLPFIVQSLSASQYFKAVAMQPFFAKTDYTLNTKLLSFEQINQKFIIQLQASLINNQNNRIIAQQIFSAQTNMAQNNAQTMANAANAATVALLKQLTLFSIKNVN